MPEKHHPANHGSGCTDSFWNKSTVEPEWRCHPETVLVVNV